MSLYPRRKTDSQSSRLSYAMKSAEDQVRADSDTKKVAVRSSEYDPVILADLTLDDFGGRSDALGG